jgi:thiol-disulfide isomerase/thioredoxin
MRPALLVVSGLLAVGAALPADPSPTATGDVRLEVVKYDRLIEAVRALRGKVVVVDVWATYCVPCKREFPHLVRLHQEYAGAGLACLSVTVDKPDKEKAALQFLQKQKATFSNYLLDEDAALWQEKWKVNGVPVVFVFDRDGRRAAKFDAEDPAHPFDYEHNVEPLVKQLLGPPR